jgi:hypothetical protein
MFHTVNADSGRSHGLACSCAKSVWESYSKAFSHVAAMEDFREQGAGGLGLQG